MKKLGLVGGVSWVSTIDYYRMINQGINERLGGHEYAECIIYSLNYGEVMRNNEANDRDKNFKMISAAAAHLKNAGAAALILCANTMHLFAEQLEEQTGLPVIHIAKATATEITKQQVKKAGLLGTKFTMELDFFKDKLTARGIETIIPGDEDRIFIHHTIFEELGKGLIKEDTRKRYIEISQKLIGQGATGIILGCTEIPLLIKQSDLQVPVFDTAVIHSYAAVDFALS